MHSFTRILIHAIFSTKYRNPLILDDFREEMHRYMGGILRNLGCTPILINSVPDHVHLLFILSNMQTIAFVMEETKRASSKWITTRFSKPDFRWQSGYCALSVDSTGLDKVQGYIARQREHHEEISFADELEEIFRRNKIEFNKHDTLD